MISPRFDVSADDLEQWTKNILPARQFGHLILTTSQGLMDQNEARKRRIGGKIVGYFY